MVPRRVIAGRKVEPSNQFVVPNRDKARRFLSKYRIPKENKSVRASNSLPLTNKQSRRDTEAQPRVPQSLANGDRAPCGTCPKFPPSDLWQSLPCIRDDKGLTMTVFNRLPKSPRLPRRAFPFRASLYLFAWIRVIVAALLDAMAFSSTQGTEGASAIIAQR